MALPIDQGGGLSPAAVGRTVLSQDSPAQKIWISDGQLDHTTNAILSAKKPLSFQWECVGRDIEHYPILSRCCHLDLLAFHPGISICSELINTGQILLDSGLPNDVFF